MARGVWASGEGGIEGRRWLAALGWAWILLGCELPGMAFGANSGRLGGLLPVPEYWEIGWRAEEAGRIGVWVREGGRTGGLRTPFREGARLELF